MSQDQPTSAVRSYFRNTHTLLYSYLVSLPLLLLYELLIFISQPDSEQVVRISVDVWIKALFANFGHNALAITLIFVALLGIVILYREWDKIRDIRLSYFAVMIVEASFYAFLLALIISQTVTEILQMAVVQEGAQSISQLQQIALSLGAGLYEELFFRVILVTLMVYLFGFLVDKRWLSVSLAVVIAALIFSLVHYIGALGDPFTFGSFLFRFLFGLALNGIYILRGFGMAAWTHAIYDIMVVAYIS